MEAAVRAKALRFHWAAVAAFLCVALPSQAQAAGDAWWGKDKQKHLLLSSGAALATYAWLGFFDVEPSVRTGATALVVLGAGALKEAWDLLGYGHPSWKDMTWNLIGLAVGLSVGWAVERWLWPKNNLWVPRLGY